MLINRLVAKKKSFLGKNPFFQKKEVPVFRATDENDNTFKKDASAWAIEKTR